MRKTWRLQATFETYEVIRGSDLLPNNVASQRIAANFDRWLTDPMARQAILDMCQSLQGPNGAPSRGKSPDEWRRYLKSQLEDALRRGDLVLLPISYSNAGPSNGEDNGASSQPESSLSPAPRPQRNKTWIEIELVDDQDNPIPNERCRLELPDGSIWEGTTDAGGIARVDYIDPGECEVNFPNIDLNEWRAA